MSRTFFFWPLKLAIGHQELELGGPSKQTQPAVGWVFSIGYPAIAGPPKATPAIAGAIVVDF